MSKISELSDGGALQSTDYLIAVRSGGNVKVQPNGTVTGTTGSFSGNVTFADNAKAIFGAGSDLQIYHDASNSYIIDNGTGSLFIRGNSQIQLQDTNTAGKFFVGTAGGAATLYHNNAAKLATTSTGIDVTGTVTADGLTVDGDITAQDSNPVLLLSDTSASNQSGEISHNAGTTSIKSSNTSTYGAIKLLANNGTSTVTRMEVDRFGDISFYEDTGTTPKFFWDASAEALGIGTANPSTDALHIVTSGLDDDDDTIVLGANFGSASVLGSIGTHHVDVNNGGLKFSSKEAGTLTERMRITSAGNVGIGTSTPGELLHLEVPAVGTSSGEVAIRMSVPSDIISAQNEIRSGVTSGTNPYISFAVRETSSPFATVERMRIDSSGNLLVGTTSTPLSMISESTGNGFGAEGDNGYIVAKRSSSSAALYVNKTGGNSGTYIQFRDDGALKGQIYSYDGTRVGIGSNGTSGIVFGAGQIVPATAGQTLADASYDLGSSSNRFKDLYLSGGVYLGGTGAANKLDDYEEGTFTPVIQGATTAGTFTYGTQSGLYTKIGNVVSVHIAINVSATSVSPVGAITVQGLPFSTSGSFQSLAVGWASGITFADQLNAYAPNSETFVVLRNSVSGSTGNQTSGSNLSSSFWLFISGAYRAT